MYKVVIYGWLEDEWKTIAGINGLLLPNLPRTIPKLGKTQRKCYPKLAYGDFFWAIEYSFDSELCLCTIKCMNAHSTFLNQMNNQCG